MPQSPARCQATGALFSGSRRSERGQATVEAALVLPLLVLSMLVVVQVGTVAYTRVLVAHAAREAARAAAVDPQTSTAFSAAADSGRLDPTRLRVGLGSQREPGERLTVIVTYQAPTDVAFVGWLVGDVELDAKVTIRIE